MDVVNKLQEIFRDVFDDENLVLTREMTSDDVEDWDSLAQINIIVASEKAFGVKFDLNDIAQLENVGDIIDLIKKMINLRTSD